MKILYERSRRVRDRTMRCYLSLACPCNCDFCSANIPLLPATNKTRWLPAIVWAAGLNRRGRKVLLCGGEPLLYPQMRELLTLLRTDIALEIYSNLMPDIGPVIASGRGARWLISLHPCVTDREKWFEQVRRLLDNGHSVRFHIVKAGDWQRRRDFLRAKGEFKVTCCDDQGTYVKSSSPNPGEVRCSSHYYVYGPDGWRYPCVTKLGLGEDPVSHISETDETDEIVTRCMHFGSCAACDNLIEGKVWRE